MFVPHHFASSTWANHKEKGYSLKTFMLMNTSGMDAQELLTAMRSTYNSFDTIEEGSAWTISNGIAVADQLLLERL